MRITALRKHSKGFIREKVTEATPEYFYDFIEMPYVVF